MRCSGLISSVILSFVVFVTRAAVQRTPLHRVTSTELGADFHRSDALDENSRITSQDRAQDPQDLDETPEGRVRKTVVSGRTFRTNEDSRAQDSRIDKGHNKSRQKSGFYNSYRRDESGTNSSFFEDTVDDGAEKLYRNGITRIGQGEDNEYRDENVDGSYKRRQNPYRNNPNYYNYRPRENHRPPFAERFYGQDEAFAEPTPPPPRQSRFGDYPAGQFGYNNRDYGRMPHSDVDPGYAPYQQRVPELADRYREPYTPPPRITVFDDPRPARVQNSNDHPGYYPGPIQDGAKYGYRPKPQLEILPPNKRFNDYGDDYPNHLESEPGRYRY